MLRGRPGEREDPSAIYVKFMAHTSVPGDQGTLLGSPCGVENSGKSCRNQLSVRRGHREDVLEMGYRGKVMKEGMYTVCFRELR